MLFSYCLEENERCAETVVYIVQKKYLEKELYEAFFCSTIEKRFFIMGLRTDSHMNREEV